MYMKKLKSLFLYILDRKAFVIIITYILSHITFLIFSWNGFIFIGILIIFVLFKNFKLFLILFLVLTTCIIRNYYDINIENKTKDYVEKNYLNKAVDLEGYVDIEPVYKHEYARVVFKIEGEEDFLIQTNTPRFPRLQVGQVCHIKGNLVEPESFDTFDYKKYLRNKRIYYLIRYPVLDCTSERKGFVLKNMLMDFKGYVRQEVEKRLLEPQASLFLGVLFGERRVFEDSFQDALRVASITHIIVASGYNVSIIYLGINKFFFFVPKRSRTLLSIFLIWIYCALVGFTPSIIRATLMLSLTLLAVYYGVVSNIHIVFFSSALFFVFLDPRIVNDFGFLLSISATGGLIYITPILDELLKKFLDFSIPFENVKKIIQKFLQNYFIPSLACTIVTMPIVAYGFQQISIVGVVTNVLILPVLEYTLILGIVTLFINFIFPYFSDPLFLTIWVQLKYFELVVEFLGNLNFVSYSVHISIPIVIMIYMVLIYFIFRFYPLDGQNYYLNLQENN